jgi:hypothetical protein
LRRLPGNGDIPGRRRCRGDTPERFGEAGRLVDLGVGLVQFLLRPSTGSRRRPAA